MYCIYCGRQLPSEARFCAFCGQRVPEALRLQEGVNPPSPAPLEGAQAHQGSAPPPAPESPAPVAPALPDRPAPAPELPAVAPPVMPDRPTPAPELPAAEAVPVWVATPPSIVTPPLPPVEPPVPPAPPTWSLPAVAEAASSVAQSFSTPEPVVVPTPPAPTPAPTPEFAPIPKLPGDSEGLPGLTAAPVDRPAAPPEMPAAPAPPVAIEPVRTAGGPEWVLIAGTGGAGAYLRRSPRLDDRLAAWAEGTRLEVVGPDIEGDGKLWKQVRDPNSQVGFIPVDYVRAAMDSSMAATVVAGLPLLPSEPSVPAAPPAPPVVVQAAPPPPVPQWVTIVTPTSSGVYLRRTPQMNDQLHALAEGARLEVVGPDVDGDGRRWKHVRDDRGQIGYVPADYARPV